MRYLFCTILLCFGHIALDAQEDDLLAGLVNEPSNNLTVATFKGTRLINFHTLEVPGKRTLDFRISHRFGPINSGIYDFFGLDGGASIRIGFDYSYDGRFCVGFGRTSYEKMLDGFLKYRLLRQHEPGGMPISLTLFTSAFATMQKDPDKDVNGFDKYELFTNRLSFVHQIIIARKFSPRFSLQIAPTMLHYNLAERISDLNDMYVLTAATRIKFTKRMALTLEYGWRATKYTRTKYYDSLGVGVDVETGGHVFQFFVTNSLGLVENQFLTRTNSKWSDAGIRLGFNISRVFTL
ncbi:MAG: hypothetical protein IT260_01160 [Saprospiraceae bacterium]|nr:hypothetical protein [Saprospiraceae bacterium]